MTLIICIRGGMVQAVASDAPLDIDVRVADYDVDGDRMDQDGEHCELTEPRLHVATGYVESLATETL